MDEYDLSSIPPQPQELAVYRITATGVTLSWYVNANPDNVVARFDLTLDITDTALGVFRVVRALDGSVRQFVLRGLLPMTTYTAHMVTIDPYGNASNRSNVIYFSTTSEDLNRLHQPPLPIHAAEILVIIFIIGVWIVAVAMFLKRWASIRILQPSEVRYRHAPKNLETIRIVKRPQDSVIYKNYSRKLSLTMVEREKRRLERMNTLPTIEMEEVLEKSDEKK